MQDSSLLRQNSFRSSLSQPTQAKPVRKDDDTIYFEKKSQLQRSLIFLAPENNKEANSSENRIYEQENQRKSEKAISIKENKRNLKEIKRTNQLKEPKWPGNVKKLGTVSLFKKNEKEKRSKTASYNSEGIRKYSFLSQQNNRSSVKENIPIDFRITTESFFSKRKFEKPEPPSEKSRANAETKNPRAPFGELAVSSFASHLNKAKSHLDQNLFETFGGSDKPIEFLSLFQKESGLQNTNECLFSTVEAKPKFRAHERLQRRGETKKKTMKHQTVMVFNGTCPKPNQLPLFEQIQRRNEPSTKSSKQGKTKKTLYYKDHVFVVDIFKPNLTDHDE